MTQSGGHASSDSALQNKMQPLLVFARKPVVFAGGGGGGDRLNEVAYIFSFDSLIFIVFCGQKHSSLRLIPIANKSTKIDPLHHHHHEPLCHSDH